MLRHIQRLSMIMGAGLLFGGLSCVHGVADTVGTGLTLTAASGLLGPATQGVTAIGSGLDLLADLARFTRIGG
jgi:hypothetical protein